MKLKVDRGLLPIKAHFFFFFAALGPLLPQLNVFGRQLGVSPGVMGMVTAVLPLLWAAAKPLFGYVVDFWPNHRKMVFMLLIAVMTGSYCGLWGVPMPEPPINQTIVQYIYRLNDTIYLEQYQNDSMVEKYSCRWNCSSVNFDVYLSNLTFVNTVYVDGAVTNTSCTLLYMDLNDAREGRVNCSPKKNCDLLCFEDDILTEVNVTADSISKLVSNRTKRELENKVPTNELKKPNSELDKPKFGNELANVTEDSSHIAVDLSKETLGVNHIDSKIASKVFRAVNPVKEEDSFYMTAPFWIFVVLMCIGTVSFNVANCIGDAVCFDVLGPERGSQYGAQRAWGTAGYGITALIGGWLVDAVSGSYKDFTPAFIIAIIATVIDLISCRALTLPSLSSPSDSGKALREVLRMPRVLVFIVFAVVAGTFDSFIIYYMFWFLEELSDQTGYKANIKLIEGVVVAGQSFIGELLFFFFSGRIINRWGFGKTMTFSLFCYGVRMALISFIDNPWKLVIIESIMQGPTYALCYSTIVGYAAHVAPEGYSATVQGIVAGMDDGVGFTFGSLLGGLLYSYLGGRGAFRTLAVVAIIASAGHAIFCSMVEKAAAKKQPPEIQEAGEKMLSVHTSAIYNDTTVPLNDGKDAR